jgi:hypothetical protein
MIWNTYQHKYIQSYLYNTGTKKCIHIYLRTYISIMKYKHTYIRTYTYIYLYISLHMFNAYIDTYMQMWSFKNKIINSNSSNLKLKTVSHFQYKFTAVYILSAASVQTSVWICVFKSVLFKTKLLKCIVLRGRCVVLHCREKYSLFDIR